MLAFKILGKIRITVYKDKKISIQVAVFIDIN